MEELFERFALKIRNLDIKFSRCLEKKINWNQKLVIVKGTRGVGKTTLILHYVKSNYKIDKRVLYVSLDDVFFTGYNLSEFIENFVSQGGKHLFIDEIHKYNGDFGEEIKEVLNKFEKLRIVLIGTSVTDYQSKLQFIEDYTVYDLQGLSLREYIYFKEGVKFPILTIEQILFDNFTACERVSMKIDILSLFDS